MWSSMVLKVFLFLSLPCIMQIIMGGVGLGLKLLVVALYYWFTTITFKDFIKWAAIALNTPSICLDATLRVKRYNEPPLRVWKLSGSIRIFWVTALIKMTSPLTNQVKVKYPYLPSCSLSTLCLLVPYIDMDQTTSLARLKDHAAGVLNSPQRIPPN